MIKRGKSGFWKEETELNEERPAVGLVWGSSGLDRGPWALPDSQRARYLIEATIIPFPCDLQEKTAVSSSCIQRVGR